MGGKPDQPFQLSFDAAMGFRIHVIPLGHPLTTCGPRRSFLHYYPLNVTAILQTSGAFDSHPAHCQVPSQLARQLR
jgi:hypothetical protein